MEWSAHLQIVGGGGVSVLDSSPNENNLLHYN